MNEKLYPFIEDYNLGRLKSPLLEEFETALAADVALAAAVRLQRAEWEMQELLAEDALRAQIRQAFSEQPPQRSWMLQNWKWTLITFLFLVTAGILFFRKIPVPEQPAPDTPPASTFPKDTVPVRDSLTPEPATPTVPKVETPDPRKYAMAAYKVPESLSGLRGATADDTLAQAYTFFNQKNYRRVIQLLAVLPADNAQEALLLRAHAQFGAGRFEAASRDFNELESGGIYLREAQWFGVLSAMAARQGNTNQTAWMKRLDEIRKNGTHPYQKQAQSLWGNLKSK